MSCRSSSGGRPGRDLQRQNSRQPARCQRTIVFGRTTITHDRQSHNRESQARLRRVAASTRRGFTPRSLKSPSCRRKTRFSASIDRRDLAVSPSKPITSPSRRRTMQAKAITPTSCHGVHARTQPQSRGSSFCGRQPSSFTMPPFGLRLSDEEVADVSNFVRTSWGNTGLVVTAKQVAKVRNAADPVAPALPGAKQR
jgi:hypothetical protein